MSINFLFNNELFNYLIFLRLFTIIWSGVSMIKCRLSVISKEKELDLLTLILLHFCFVNFLIGFTVFFSVEVEGHTIRCQTHPFWGYVVIITVNLDWNKLTLYCSWQYPVSSRVLKVAVSEENQLLEYNLYLTCLIRMEMKVVR